MATIGSTIAVRIWRARAPFHRDGAGLAGAVMRRARCRIRPSRVGAAWSRVVASTDASTVESRGTGGSLLGGYRPARHGRLLAHSGRHQHADLVPVGRPAVDDRDDLAAVHHGDPVAQLEDLVELGGDEQHGRPGIALA